MRIMYVEDNPANLFLVKRVARMGNHEVLNYIDGEDALEYFERDSPDLVLMDLQLAGEMSGLEVVQKLRAAGHKTPMVAVTAYAMVGDRDRCLNAGCDEYLAKPLSVPRLVELIQHYAGKSSPEPDKISETLPVRPVAFTPPSPPEVASSSASTKDTHPATPAPKPAASNNGTSADSGTNDKASTSPPDATTR